MILITTETGSKYLLDMENKTWERVRSTLESGYLRTPKGPFLSAEYEKNGHLALTCPPIRDGSTFRYIQTSRIVKIESPNNGQEGL